MQFVLPIIALFILGVAEVSMNTTPTPTPTPEKEAPKQTETKTEKKNEIYKNETETNSSVKVIVTVEPKVKSKEKSSPANYFYPGATVTSQSGAEINLESNDSTEQVTEWYKNYIEINSMNTTSFMTTNTNNNVLNRLVGTGNGQKIDVEIKKNSEERTTRIKILLNS